MGDKVSCCHPSRRHEDEPEAEKLTSDKTSLPQQLQSSSSQEAKMSLYPSNSSLQLSNREIYCGSSTHICEARICQND